LHAKLLSEEVGLLRTILMALAPATGLVDDDVRRRRLQRVPWPQRAKPLPAALPLGAPWRQERDKVAPYLLELPAGHKVEPEAGLRVAMVDTLLLLGTKAASRQIMRSTGVVRAARGTAEG